MAGLDSAAFWPISMDFESLLAVVHDGPAHEGELPALELGDLDAGMPDVQLPGDGADVAIDHADILDGIGALDAAAPQPRRRIWTGLRRSEPLMVYVRQCRETKAENAKKRRSGDKLRNVAVGWDQLAGLREGDKLAVDDHRDGPGLNPNTWDLRQTIRMAFKSFGAHAPVPRGAVGVGDTCRKLEAVSAIASITKIAQQDPVQDFVKAARAGRVGSIFMALHHDATPVLVKFGTMVGKVYDWARYLHKDEQGKWHTLRLED